MKAYNTIKNKQPDLRMTTEMEQIVQDWFEKKDGREYIMQKIEEDISNISTEEVTLSIDSERMKNRFLECVRKDVKRKKIIQRFSIAATWIPFILLCGALTFIVDRTGLFRSEVYTEFRVPYGEQMQVALQDGSVVMLNSGSCLYCPKSFSLFERKVRLVGEGFFSIVKDEKRPFIVDLNGVDIGITGTEFNVKAYPEESLVYVTLTKGSVYLQDQNDKKYFLTEGKTAKYNRQSLACSISRTKDESAVTAWRFKTLNFYQTPLKEIVKVLERQYNVQFTTEDSSLLEYCFTISTSKRQIEDILKDLEKVSYLRFIPDDKGDFVIKNMP